MQLLQETTFRLSPDPIFSFEQDGTIQHANPAAARLCGIAAPKLAGRAGSDIICKADQRLYRDLIDRVARGETVERCPLRVRGSDGEFVWTEWNAAPGDEPGGVIAIGRVVTEQRRAREDLVRQLTAANHELEVFSYSVSHDLRGPLRAINGFSEALREDCGERLDDAGRDYLQRIRTATLRMSELVDGLLELSRIMRHQMATARVDLGALAEEVSRELQAGAPERSVIWHIDPTLSCLGDATLLQALLRHLLGNAFKFTAQRSPAFIVVGRQRQPGREIFFVNDNGAGFDMSHAHKLFQPFERLHGSEFPGVGIGLATVRRIIQRHGGEVWAEGEEGKGTTVFFTVNGGRAASD